MSSRPYQEVDYDAVLDQVVESIDGEGGQPKPTQVPRKPSMIQPLAPAGVKKSGKSVLQELTRMVRKDPGRGRTIMQDTFRAVSAVSAFQEASYADKALEIGSSGGSMGSIGENESIDSFANNDDSSLNGNAPLQSPFNSTLAITQNPGNRKYSVAFNLKFEKGEQLKDSINDLARRLGIEPDRLEMTEESIGEENRGESSTVVMVNNLDSKESASEVVDGLREAAGEDFVDSVQNVHVVAPKKPSAPETPRPSSFIASPSRRRRRAQTLDYNLLCRQGISQLFPGASEFELMEFWSAVDPKNTGEVTVDDMLANLEQGTNSSKEDTGPGPADYGTVTSRELNQLVSTGLPLSRQQLPVCAFDKPGTILPLPQKNKKSDSRSSSRPSTSGF